jgi:hypothetical protein
MDTLHYYVQIFNGKRKRKNHDKPKEFRDRGERQPLVRVVVASKAEKARSFVDLLVPTKPYGGTEGHVLFFFSQS